MDEFLLITAVLLHLIGIAGCILPIIPGPLVSFFGLWAVNYTRFADYSDSFLIWFLIIALVVLAIDFVIPIIGTRLMGGSKAGTWGATLGLVLGIIFFPPWGLIIGPFLGAFIVEMTQGKSFNKSLKAGMGSLIGFVLGTGLKLAASFTMAWYFVVEVI